MAEVLLPGGDIDKWPRGARFALGDEGTLFVLGAPVAGEDGPEFAVYAPGHWARATNDPPTD